MNFIQNHVSDLFASRPPYLKEGVVVRKHLLENGSQRAKHREWKECFLVVSNGELKMYTMHGSVSEERRSVLRVSSVSNFATLADSLGNGTGGSTSSQTRSSGSVASVRNTPGGGSHQWTVSRVVETIRGIFIYLGKKSVVVDAAHGNNSAESHPVQYITAARIQQATSSRIRDPATTRRRVLVPNDLSRASQRMGGNVQLLGCTAE